MEVFMDKLVKSEVLLQRACCIDKFLSCFIILMISLCPTAINNKHLSVNQKANTKFLISTRI